MTAAITSLLNDDEFELQRTARRFMEAEVVPLTPEMEAKGVFPRSLFRSMGDLAYSDRSFLRRMAASARRCRRALKQKYLVPVLCGEKIGSMVITEPKGGSDALSACTNARKDGGDYVINGSKTFITNAPVANFILVIARISGEARKIDGGTWFILERGMPGLRPGSRFARWA